MTNHVSTLNVLLYGEPIATITNVGNDRTLFAFMDSYINDESRPVLGLGFKDSLGGLLTSFKPTQTKLTPFFSNLLPEDKCNKEEVCTQLQEILYTQVEKQVQNDGVNSN